MATKTLTRTDSAASREAWVRVVNELADEVSAWAHSEPGWEVPPFERRDIEEEGLGLYEVPVVTIHTPGGQLTLEPGARGRTGKGAVPLHASPTFRRIRLLHDVAGAKWQVMTDSGVPLRQPWNRETFITLAHDLLAT